MPLINTYTDKNNALERSLNSNRCKADVKSTYMYLNSRDFVLSIGENKESTFILVHFMTKHFSCLCQHFL